ncbi:SLA class II histocompatibility antigen, DQ haplotype C beta chain-like [Scyliorhinus canicula]|uniref:SLA class II histocompatibility antigen, DQ haplotype C beta chain-like n=1 Tax=Scyliorhinus canicula TaxID=7830 RepID=UPI0018F7B1FE|nr:SLA class II histocompatibility antigen, DQ haplotype C beta chain-like [Scyliorhinus canicula]
MSLLRMADSRSLWIRICLLTWSLIIFNGERESGAGAHTYNFLNGCRFNSTKVWTPVWQQVYDQQLTTYFDFNQKKYIAVKDWMKGNVERWNKESRLEQYQEMIAVCENNVPINSKTVSRKVKPTVTIRPKASPHSGHSVLLSCRVTGFYPPEIDVTWLKNGVPVPDGVINTVMLSDGDWTYQVEDLLQYHPESGDKYTCHVEHSSLNEPRITDWEVGSTTESEKPKIIVGVLVFIIGFIILLAGVIMRLKNAKAILDSSSQGPRLMSPTIS